METLFKPGDVVVLRTDLSAGMFYPMLEKKEIDGETYYLPSSNLVTAKAASWEMIDWINKRPFKTETIETVVNGTYRLLCCYYHPNNWTDSMFDIVASKKLQEENKKRKGRRYFWITRAVSINDIKRVYQNDTVQNFV